jgi:polysaccharide deacetylase 2 family uncharacterized protein YibQ
MTDHDTPDTLSANELDGDMPQVQKPKKTFHDFGWMLWTALFCLALLGLAIAGLSQSEQIERGLKIVPTIERQVAQLHETTPPDQLSPEQETPDETVATDHDTHDKNAVQDGTIELEIDEQPVTPSEQLPTEEKSEPKSDHEKPIEPTPEPPSVFVPDEAPPQTETPVHIDQQSRINYTPLPDAIPASVTAQPSVPVQAENPQFKAPVIAIVIDDMGLDRRHSAQIVALATPITVAYMPYAEQLAQQTSQAWRAGHELMVHMPMEPGNLAQNNPGPDALLVKNGADENVRRLNKNLDSFQGYMGINNHMGSAFTVNRAAITPIMQVLKQKGVWFLDSKTDGRSLAGIVAGEMGVPFAVRDVFLDNVNSKDYVLKQLAETERVARQKGYAVAIGHPRSGTVQALAEWLPRLAERHIRVVPLSSIIHARFPKAPVPQYARMKDLKHTDATVSALVQK